jgi:hypothetical protein
MHLSGISVTSPDQHVCWVPPPERHRIPPDRLLVTGRSIGPYVLEALSSLLVVSDQVLSASYTSEAKVVASMDSETDLDTSLGDTTPVEVPVAERHPPPQFAIVFNPDKAHNFFPKSIRSRIRIDFDFLAQRMALTYGPTGPISGIVRREYPSRYPSHTVIHGIREGFMSPSLAIHAKTVAAYFNSYKNAPLSD